MELGQSYFAITFLDISVTTGSNYQGNLKRFKSVLNIQFYNLYDLGTDHLNFWGVPGLFLVRPSFFFLLQENQDIFFSTG